jgi:hypothetical protein
VAVVDANSNPRNVAVSLSWTGTGTTTRDHSTTRIVTGNVTTTIRTRDASRNATLTGSVDALPVIPADVADAMLFTDATVTTSR